jgi:hypothetical protein
MRNSLAILLASDPFAKPATLLRNIDEEGKMKHSLLSQHTDSIKKQICELQQNKNKKTISLFHALYIVLY